jgi:hypothetical protein
VTFTGEDQAPYAPGVHEQQYGMHVPVVQVPRVYAQKSLPMPEKYVGSQSGNIHAWLSTVQAWLRLSDIDPDSWAGFASFML